MQKHTVYTALSAAATVSEENSYFGPAWFKQTKVK